MWNAAVSGHVCLCAAEAKKDEGASAKTELSRPPRGFFFMRRWDRERDMEVAMEEVEALLEKIWDLHDKLSDAILSISRSHFLKSLSANKKPSASGNHKTNNNLHSPPAGKHDDDNSRTPGFVFVKDFAVYDEAIHEAKSLNSIRSALENLEDQLEFLHTVQIQQRAERDTAIARLEQSRIVLAMRLAEHQGKKYKVIEEALAFLGDVRETSRIFSPENVHNAAGENSGNQNKSILIRALFSSLNFAKNSLRLDHAGGLLGNAALVAITLMAMLNCNQVSENGHIRKHRIYNCGGKRSSTEIYGHEDEAISRRGSSGQLDVRLARG